MPYPRLPGIAVEQQRVDLVQPALVVSGSGGGGAAGRICRLFNVSAGAAAGAPHLASSG